jgi:hypothetical protein
MFIYLSGQRRPRFNARRDPSGRNKMRRYFAVIAAVAGTALLAGSAFAADLKDAEIKELISGKTIYLALDAGTVTGATGTGMIYYNPDGTALYKLPDGKTWHGTWTIKDNQGCVVWKEATNNACTRYDKAGDVITMINVATGKPRGKLVKTAAGNAENIAP